MRHKILIFFLLVFICCKVVHSQNQQEYDSLLTVLKTHKVDSVRVDIMERILVFNLESDPVLAGKYADSIIEISTQSGLNSGKATGLFQKANSLFYDGKNEDAIVWFKKAYAQYELNGDTDLMGKTLSEIALTYYYLQEFDKTISYYEKAGVLLKKVGDKGREANIHNNTGVVYKIWGKHQEAAKEHFKALQIREELNDTGGMIQSYNNLGIVYEALNNHDKAIEYFKSALKWCDEWGDSNSVAQLQNNIGSIYMNTNDFTKAKEYFDRALKLYLAIGEKRTLGIIYNNLGQVEEKTGNFGEAIVLYKKALVYRDESSDKQGYAITSNSIGTTLISMKRYREAIQYLERGLAISTGLNDVAVNMDTYEALLEAYTQVGDCNKALIYSKLYKVTKDSIFQIKSAESLAEMQTLYETEKKEQQIKLQEVELKQQDDQIARQELEKEKKEQQFNFLVIILLLMVVLMVISYFAYRKIRKSNKQLAWQKNEILEKNEELQQQNEEIVAQRDEIEFQKEILQTANTEITDSIEYAKRIQQAVLPEQSGIAEIMGEHFIFFRPQHIVSGDFYWARLVRNKLFFLVADCTGHGVPGAFMSMLGIALIRETIGNIDITELKASDVLELLRGNLIKALHQTGKDDEQKDGMDMSLCVMDQNGRDNKQLQFAGANNPLYLVLKEEGQEERIETLLQNTSIRIFKHSVGIKQLIEVKGNSMPVGFQLRMAEFTNNEMQLEKGDQLYLFSDGFPDQMGGPNGKKLKYNVFKELLIDISSKNPEEQHFLLGQKLDSWMGHDGISSNKLYTQIDDITIFGVKI